MKRKILNVYLGIVFTLACVFTSCSNSNSSGSGSSIFDEDISLFNDSEVNISVSSSEFILSDGVWTYACEMTGEYSDIPPLEAKSFITLKIDNNGSTYQYEKGEWNLRHTIPAGVSDAEIEEVIEDLKTSNQHLGIYIKDADVYRDGNYINIKKALTQQEIEQIGNINLSTSELKKLFYVNHDSIVKTNIERTKYKITVEENTTSSRERATVWLIKQN